MLLEFKISGEARIGKRLAVTPGTEAVTSGR
jgi:hypothetical protein